MHTTSFLVHSRDQHRHSPYNRFSCLHRELSSAVDRRCFSHEPQVSTPGNAGHTPRPRLTPLVRLPDKGSAITSPAPGPPEQTFEPAFSDEEEEHGHVKGAAMPAAVATAETESEVLRQGNEAVGNAAAGMPEGITGEHSHLRRGH